MPTFSSAEVGRHNGPKSTWMIIANDVYDVTKFLDSHPGGEQSLLDFAGKDATVAFETVGHSADARDMMKTYKVGTLPQTEHSSHAKSCCKPTGPTPCPSDESLKLGTHRVEFLVYPADCGRQSPSKSTYSTPKSSTAKITPRVQTVVVPKDKSSKLKWALLALASALVIGFVINKYANK